MAERDLQAVFRVDTAAALAGGSFRRLGRNAAACRLSMRLPT
jgi:hypothetical protein